MANATPVVFGGGMPIDGGRKFIDGRPIFGPGKTVRGFIAGLVAGTLVGSLQWLATEAFGIWQGGQHWVSEWFRQYYSSIAVSGALGAVTLGFMLALGALLGDMMGSFVKRRLGLPRGSRAIGLDQLGFVAIALLLASLVASIGWQMVVVLFVLTLPIHMGTNFLNYKLGLKSKPY